MKDESNPYDLPELKKWEEEKEEYKSDRDWNLELDDLNPNENWSLDKFDLSGAVCCMILALITICLIFGLFSL